MKKITYPMKKERLEQARKVKISPLEDGIVWRCKSCGRDVLGIFQGGVLTIKYKERVVKASGVIVIPCRDCKFENRLDTNSLGYRVNVVMSNEDLEIPATPMARKLANQYNIDLRDIKAPKRITVRDVKRHLNRST